MKHKYMAYALAFIVLGLTVILVRQRLAFRELEARPSAYATDERYIQKAVQQWSAREGGTAVAAMDGRFIKTMHFTGEVCVSLELLTGGVGAVPVYCFEKASGRLVSKFEDVE